MRFQVVDTAAPARSARRPGAERASWTSIRACISAGRVSPGAHPRRQPGTSQAQVPNAGCPTTRTSVPGSAASRTRSAAGSTCATRDPRAAVGNRPDRRTPAGGRFPRATRDLRSSLRGFGCGPRDCRVSALADTHCGTMPHRGWYSASTTRTRHCGAGGPEPRQSAPGRPRREGRQAPRRARYGSSGGSPGANPPPRRWPPTPSAPPERPKPRAGSQLSCPRQKALTQVKFSTVLPSSIVGLEAPLVVDARQHGEDQVVLAAGVHDRRHAGRVWSRRGPRCRRCTAPCPR